MQSPDPFTIPSTGSLLDAATVIEQNGSRAAIVIQDGKAIGVISEGDILRAILRGTEVHAPLIEAMKYSFKYAHSEDINEALELFAKLGISLLPIVKDDFELTGVITVRDVLEAAQLP